MPRIRTHVYAFVSEKTIDSFPKIKTHSFKIRGREAKIHWCSFDVPFASTEVLWFDAPSLTREQPKDIQGAFCNQRFVLTGLGGTVRFRIGQSSDLGVGEVDVNAPFEIIEYSLHAWEHPKVNFKSLDPPPGSVASSIPEISNAAWNVIRRESIRLIGVDGVAVAPKTVNLDVDEWDYQIVRSFLFSNTQLGEVVPKGRANALDLKHVKEVAKIYKVSTHRKHGDARKEHKRISDKTGFGIQSVRKQITEGIKLGLIQIPPKEEGKSK